jgi:hypothetical protein
VTQRAMLCATVVNGRNLIIPFYLVYVKYFALTFSNSQYGALLSSPLRDFPTKHRFRATGGEHNAENRSSYGYRPYQVSKIRIAALTFRAAAKSSSRAERSDLPLVEPNIKFSQLSPTRP